LAGQFSRKGRQKSPDGVSLLDILASQFQKDRLLVGPKDRDLPVQQAVPNQSSQHSGRVAY
jgi:hypothetical protein